jgi:segregation and condensation protein B
LTETASGYRLQTRQDFRPWVAKHQEEKAPKYSRAFLETLALIAWRQPVTRAEIEDIRGVGINSNVIKTLLEREWIRVLGHKEVPGRPEMLGTTRQFLDYFNLKSLDELPGLTAIRDLDVENLPLELLQQASPEEGETDEDTLP